MKPFAKSIFVKNCNSETWLGSECAFEIVKLWKKKQTKPKLCTQNQTCKEEL